MSPTSGPFDPEALAEELSRAHGVHTVILYGSRARGDATPASDVDVAGFREGPATRDSRTWNGLVLDAFIHPDSALHEPSEPFLKLVGGRVLRDRDGRGARFLDALVTLERRGPEPLAESDRAARVAWIRRMLARAREGGPEGDYRRAWLLFDLLESYFVLRGRWFRGPKESLAWLAREDAESHAKFVEALRPGASIDSIARLVERVLT